MPTVLIHIIINIFMTHNSHIIIIAAANLMILHNVYFANLRVKLL